MPYKIEHRNRLWAVVNTENGTNHGWTTKEKAEAQLRLLLAMEYNPHFIKKETNK